jgi:putative transposase
MEFEKRWQLQRRSATHKLHFESDDGELLSLSDDEVLQKWRLLEWQIDTDKLETTADILYFTTPADLQAYPEKPRLEAERRKQYLDAIDPAQLKYKPEIWQSIIFQCAIKINDKNPPSAITVQGWWRRFRESKSITVLMPRYGHRQTSQNVQGYKVFEEVVESSYLNNRRIQSAEIVRRVQQKVSILNINKSQTELIRKPSRNTIYRWLRELRQDLVDASRLGADYSRSKYRTSSGTLSIKNILERVEIDHTPLDLIVLDSTTWMPIGRPWITLATDASCRMIIGFYITFSSPSSHSVLQCLRHAILPKSLTFTGRPAIKGQWPAFGIPILIAVDNGMDLHSSALEKTCLELGIQVLYCPLKSPEDKGRIERFNRTINQDFIHQLPGSVFSNIVERGDHPSETEAAIDMATLTYLITKWIVDIYNLSPHKGIDGNNPLNRWLEQQPHKIIELPANPRSLDVITGIPATRTCFHYGIELEGLYYNAQPLQELRRISGKNLKIDLKFFEDQTEWVEVLDPHKMEYFRAYANNQTYTQGLHRETHRIIRAQIRKRFGELSNSEQLLEARAEIEALVQSARLNKKMGIRKRAAQLQNQNSAEIIQPSPIPRKISVNHAPEELPSGLEDELPELSLGKKLDKRGSHETV